MGTVMSAFTLLEWMMATQLIMCKNGTKMDVLTLILFIPENPMTVAMNICAMITFGMHQMSIAPNLTLIRDCGVGGIMSIHWVVVSRERIFLDAVAVQDSAPWISRVMVIDTRPNQLPNAQKSICLRSRVHIIRRYVCNWIRIYLSWQCMN